MFCPKCGSIMKVAEKDKKKILSCGCGYYSDDMEKAKIKDNHKYEKKEINIVEKEIETLPITGAVCPKCRHKKAYFWTAQTRAGDEPETKFLKCEKCMHRWRDYS